MSVRYFYHLTRDDENNRYLINVVIATAFLEQGHINVVDDADLLASLAPGTHDTRTSNPVNSRTLDLFYDVLDLYLQEGTINRPYYATL